MHFMLNEAVVILKSMKKQVFDLLGRNRSNMNLKPTWHKWSSN